MYCDRGIRIELISCNFRHGSVINTLSTLLHFTRIEASIVVEFPSQRSLYRIIRRTSVSYTSSRYKYWFTVSVYVRERLPDSSRPYPRRGSKFRVKPKSRWVIYVSTEFGRERDEGIPLLHRPNLIGCLIVSPISTDFDSFMRKGREGIRDEYSTYSIPRHSLSALEQLSFARIWKKKER